MNISAFKTLLFACLSLVAFSTVARAAAEKAFPNFNIAVTPPDFWADVTSYTPQKGLIVALKDARQTRMIEVVSKDSPAPVEVNDQFVAAFEKGVAQVGAPKRLSGRFVIVQGIKCYERTSTLATGGKIISVVSRAIPGSKRFYLLQGFRSDGGNAADDPEITRFFQSFRFLQAPARPTAPAGLDANSVAGQIGRLTLPVLAIIFVIGMVVRLIRS